MSEESAVGREARSDLPVVLVVDDERPIRLLLGEVIRACGYRSLLASHGEQALDLVQEQWPDVVITDLMMPGMDGGQLIAALREDAAVAGRKPPPVILITAARGRVVAAAGAQIVLYKPFDMEDLESALVCLLRSSPDHCPESIERAD